MSINNFLPSAWLEKMTSGTEQGISESHCEVLVRNSSYRWCNDLILCQRSELLNTVHLNSPDIRTLCPLLMGRLLVSRYTTVGKSHGFKIANISHHTVTDIWAAPRWNLIAAWRERREKCYNIMLWQFLWSACEPPPSIAASTSPSMKRIFSCSEDSGSEYPERAAFSQRDCSQRVLHTAPPQGHQ